MKNASRVLVALTLMLAVMIAASPLTAQDKKKAKKTGKPKNRPLPAYIERIFNPKGITFNAEQKEKVAALKKDLGEKIVGFQKKRRSILTDEQRKARGAAFKAAREAKKKGEELRNAVDAAAKLTDEQKEQMNAVQKEQRELLAKIRAAINELLTDEQRQSLKKGKSKAKKKKDE